MAQQLSVVENFILSENYINTFLESSEDIESIDEASIIDSLVSKIKSIPKDTKLEIKKRTPEELKKFKESKQYKNLKAKLEKKAAKTIAKESKAKGFKMNNPEVIKKHKLYMLVSGLLEIICGYTYTLYSVTHNVSLSPLLCILAYQALRSTETFSDFLDACNALLKSKTPSIWNWLNKVENTIFELDNDENKISGKDESYAFTLDY